jgi:hypothetical protein
MRGRTPTRDEIIEALHVLGLHLPTTVPDVIRAHRALTRTQHPDRFRLPRQKARATEEMKRINHARALLMDHLEHFLLTYKWRWTYRGCVRCCAAYADIWPLDPRD